MSKKLRVLIFIILTALISSGIVYSQTKFWEPTNVPLSESTIGSVAVGSNGDIWIGYIGGLFVSTDNCDTWVRKNGLLIDNMLVYQIAINPVNGYLFVTAGNNRGHNCYRSTDNGENWVKILDAKATSTMFITPSGEMYYNLTGDGIHYSSDNGDTWINKSDGLPTNFEISSFALGVDGTLYVGGYTDNGESVYRSRNSVSLYPSTNGGNEWLLVLEIKNINSVTLSPINDMTIVADGSIFVTLGADVLKSTDKGITWNKTNVGIPNHNSSLYSYGRKITYNPITGHIILSCSYSGIYRSTDVGVSWHQISNKLEGVGGYYTHIVVNSTTGMMFVLAGNVLYRSTEAIYSNQVVSVEEPEEIPSAYSLSQNYPNPFNPTTTIQYAIPKDEFVKLTVYDVTGKIVKELVNGYKTAGRYSVEFNASSYSSGTYYYKIEGGKYKNILKMMIVK
jgi:photosystem II stability/assembly factor-like uncharacterized protein